MHALCGLCEIYISFKPKERMNSAMKTQDQQGYTITLHNVYENRVEKKKRYLKTIGSTQIFVCSLQHFEKLFIRVIGKKEEEFCYECLRVATLHSVCSN